MIYPIALAVISVGVMGLEQLRPAREQRILRPGLGWDLLHLIFNGHFLGVFIYVLGARHVAPVFDGWLGAAGLTDLVYFNAAADWPIWVQIPVVLLLLDFVHWCIHRLLHRIPFLWSLHQVHHSVVDGQMDWIVAFRFSWSEVVVYKALQYLPLAWFGFSGEAMMVHAVFGTLIGHLNHANLDVDYGRLGYLLNNPRMHLHHHDHDGPPTGQNFGVIFSCWDWMFGTANVPDAPPARLGYPGVETMPVDFFAQEAWPVKGWGTSVLGALLLVAAYLSTR